MVDQPHILLIHCHDLGRQLGAYGAGSVDSPALDRLAEHGIVADRMFTTAPQCSPSRAALFTGRYPHCTGVLGLTHAEFGFDLRPDEIHLAARLRGAGYRTELIGAHHESRVLADQEIAARLGFDRARTGGLADRVADRACAALGEAVDHDQPFYLQVGFVEPHRLPGARDAPGVMGFLGDQVEPDRSRGVAVPPYLQADPDAETEIAELQGAIAHVDRAIGRVLDQLERLDLAEDTITIFTTDHGLALPRAKCSLYDPGVEVAFMINWPGGGWTGGRRLGELLSNVDVVPTLLEGLGLAADSGPPIQGQSFAAALAGEAVNDPRDAVFGELTYHDYYDPRRSIRTDRWKLIANFSSAPAFMDPSQGWRRRCVPIPSSHTERDYHPPVELYDLGADPLELLDLAEDPAHQQIRAELSARLRAWMVETDDPLLAGAVTGPLHRKTLGLLGAPGN